MATSKSENRATEAFFPQHSSHLIGYESLEKSLHERIVSNRLPQSILITGTKGVGKATLAYKLARFLLSHEANPPVPSVNLFGDPVPANTSLDIAQDHPVSRRMIAGSHPDFLLVTPEYDDRKKDFKEEISVDSARRISEFFSLTPAESFWRVVLVDSIDQFNRNAANSILKILEEPPPRSVLLLVSHNPSGLLPTIRSRCQVLAMPKLSHEKFLEIFRRFDLQLTAGDEQAYAVLSNYSPGFAHMLWQQDAFRAYKELLHLVATTRSAPLVSAFCEEWCRKDGAQRWRTLIWILDTVIHRVMSSPDTEVFPKEPEYLGLLRNAKSLDSWFMVWEKAIRLCADASHIHLDKKLVLSQILQMMKAEQPQAA
jgi:DNA polymerase-3 subunit delta'